MKRLWICLLFTVQLMMASAAQALLTPGTTAPDFTLRAAQGSETFDYRLYEALEKGPVVIFFYPKAFTGGCTVQARLFARAKEQFTAQGASIIGVSADSLDVAKAFSQKECSSAFPVGADPDGKVVKTYDVSMMFGSTTSKRASYVITPDRKIFYVYSDMSPQEHVTKTLNALKRWQSQQLVPVPMPAPVEPVPAGTGSITP